MTDDGPESVADPAAEERPVAVALENRLMSHGIYVTSFTWMEPTETPPTTGPGSNSSTRPYPNRPRSRDEVGAVVRALLTIGDEREWTPGRLEATSLTTDGETRGWWYAEREWFERLGSDLSQLEFFPARVKIHKNYRSEHDGR